MSHSRRLCVATVMAMACVPALQLGAEPPAAAPLPSTRPQKAQSHITEALLAKLPKYAPPAPATPSSQEAVDSGEEILRLPKITVRPSPILPETDYAWLNAKGKLELALKANPGIRLGDVLGLNDTIARTMQRDERLAAKKAKLADQVQRSTLGDSELDKKIRALTRGLQQRSGTERDFPSVYLPPRESRGRPKR